MIRPRKLTISSRIWNAWCQRNIFWKQLFMQWLGKIRSRRIICVLLKTFSKWWVHHHLNAIQSRVDSAWLNASLFSSSLMTCLCTSSQFGHISLMMMTSIGTSESLLLRPRNLKKLKKLFFKFRMNRTSRISAISLGCAAAISWILSRILHGRFIFIWRLQTSLWIFSISLPMIATRWGNFTIPSKHSMFLRDLTQTPSSGKEREVQPLEYSKWL